MDKQTRTHSLNFYLFVIKAVMEQHPMLFKTKSPIAIPVIHPLTYAGWLTGKCLEICYPVIVCARSLEALVQLACPFILSWVGFWYFPGFHFLCSYVTQSVVGFPKCLPIHSKGWHVRFSLVTCPLMCSKSFSRGFFCSSFSFSLLSGGWEILEG